MQRKSAEIEIALRDIANKPLHQRKNLLLSVRCLVYGTSNLIRVFCWKNQKSIKCIQFKQYNISIKFPFH